MYQQQQKLGRTSAREKSLLCHEGSVRENDRHPYFVIRDQPERNPYSVMRDQSERKVDILTLA